MMKKREHQFEIIYIWLIGGLCFIALIMTIHAFGQQPPTPSPPPGPTPIVHHHHDHLGLHQVFLWFWFIFGALVYMVKRAYYLIKGPNPVATGVEDFVKVAGIPLGFRLVVDSGIYWACFAPEVLQSALAFFGWQAAAGTIAVVTKFSVFALFFGLGIDPLVDWVIGTVVGKLPFLKDFWPQMPPALPQQAPVDPIPITPAAPAVAPNKP